MAFTVAYLNVACRLKTSVYRPLTTLEGKERGCYKHNLLCPHLENWNAEVK